jgi:hypothetical protein
MWVGKRQAENLFMTFHPELLPHCRSPFVCLPRTVFGYGRERRERDGHMIGKTCTPKKGKSASRSEEMKLSREGRGVGGGI